MVWVHYYSQLPLLWFGITPKLWYIPHCVSLLLLLAHHGLNYFTSSWDGTAVWHLIGIQYWNPKSRNITNFLWDFHSLFLITIRFVISLFLSKIAIALNTLFGSGFVRCLWVCSLIISCWCIIIYWAFDSRSRILLLLITHWSSLWWWQLAVSLQKLYWYENFALGAARFYIIMG